LSRFRLPTNLHHEHVRPSRVFWACISVLLKSADRFGIFLSAAAASALAALAVPLARSGPTADLAAARWAPEPCSAARARGGIGGPQGSAVAGTNAPRCGSAGRRMGGPHVAAAVSGWRFGIGGPQGRSDIAQIHTIAPSSCSGDALVLQMGLAYISSSLESRS